MGGGRRSIRVRRSTTAGVVTFALGVALSAGFTLWLARDNDRTAAGRFSALARRTADQIHERLSLYEYGLRGSRGAMIGAGHQALTRARFHQYTESRDIEREFPGARGMGIIRRVAQADEAAFIENARADDYPSFTIRQLAPHAGDRYVIQYIEPIAGNQQAVGLDIASEPQRRRAAEASMRSGDATLTGPITLVQAEQLPQRSFLLLLPIYVPDRAVATPEQRIEATVGWAYAPLSMDEVLADLRLGSSCFLALRDAESPRHEPFFASAPAAPPAAAGLEEHLNLKIYGRDWQAEFRATPTFLAELDRTEPRRVAVAGIAIAALLAALAHILAESRERQRQLRAEQARHAAIVASSNDAIIGETLDGIITDWNRGAELLFGYPPEAAIGRPAAELLLEAERASDDLDIREAMARGETLAPFDATRLRADGTRVDVSVTASPITGPAGNVIGFSKTIRDISGARRAERQTRELNAELERQVAERTALHESARQALQNTLDAVPFAVAYVDRDMRLRFANKACGGWFGRTPAELVGSSVSEVLGDRYEESRTRLEAVQRGEPQTFEGTLPLPGRAGLRHTVRHYLPDAGSDAVRGFHVVAYDLTEQVVDKLRLAAALRDKEALLRAIHLHAIVSVTDRSDRIVDVNDNFCRISGYAREELVGQRHRIVSSRTHDAAFWRDVWRTIGGGQPWRGEICNRAKDGSLYWVDSMIAPFTDEHGRIERYVSIRFDITAAKRAELALRETSSLLRTVLESASEVSVIATDPDLHITVFNAGAERLLGYESAEVVDKASPMLIHDADEVRVRGEELSRLSGEQVEGGAVFTHPLALRQPHEWTYVRKDGTRVSVSLVVTAMHGPSGELFGYLGVAHDVTKQKQTEASLRDSMQRAEQASLAKSRFLANMSHEIRTPMNAIIGLSYLLGQTALDPEQSEFLTKIRTSSQTLLSLVNDILDLSKIEAGGVTLEQAPFDLREIINEVRDLMSTQAEAKGIAHELDVPERLAPAYIGDATRIGQVLTNLVANAIKFTERGVVRLRVREEGATAGLTRLRFEIEDTGIGISAEEQARLFVPFAQADASTTRRFGGTGLGLSIVKRLVEMMDGAVGLSSRPGVGSTFWVTLSLRVPTTTGFRQRTPIDESAGAAPLAGARVLVVDDSDVNLMVAERILRRHGATTSSARNGLEAIDRLRDEPTAFDVVLMDGQMPVLDGYAATQRIRAELGLTTLPIIALTADARSTERERSSAVGMDDFVSKPFDVQTLVQAILRNWGAHGPSSPSRARAGDAVNTSGAWPELEGIERDEARRRFGSDRRLFLSMLARLFEEFDDLSSIAAGSTTLDLAHLAARAHKLNGAAGQLAARDIQALAAKVEALSREGAAAKVAALVAPLAAALERLRLGAAPWLQAHSRAEAGEPPASGSAAAVDLDELLQLLRGQDLALVDRLPSLSGPLSTALGRESLDLVRDHIRHLRFQDALDVVERGASGARPG